MMPQYRMPGPLPPCHGRQSGFTLVELVIVMVIAAILAAIAIPMYLSQIRESRRTDARTALLDLAGREERYFATNNAYTSSSVDLGYTTAAQGSAWPQTVGGGYYNVTVSVPAAAPDPNAATIAAPSYSITAQAISSQTADTCSTLTVDSTGQQTAVLSSGGQDTSSTCWGAQ